MRMMLATSKIALCFVVGYFLVSCKATQTQETPRDSLTTVAARFPVGSVPVYQAHVPGGPAAGCSIHFKPNNILHSENAPDGRAVVRARGMGQFRASCDNDPTHTNLLFEAVTVASINVTWMGNTPAAQMSSDPQRGRQTLTVHALDQEGREFRTVAGEGFWKLAAGCDVTMRVSAPPMVRGVHGPSHTLELVALGQGMCGVEVEYLSFRRMVVVTSGTPPTRQPAS
jgi:hypothetical protein